MSYHNHGTHEANRLACAMGLLGAVREGSAAQTEVIIRWQPTNVTTSSPNHFLSSTPRFVLVNVLLKDKKQTLKRLF